MPSESIAQQHLMQAAGHGANFPMAEKIRASMSPQQIHEFASGSMKGKPEHAAKHAAREHALHDEIIRRLSGVPAGRG